MNLLSKLGRVTLLSCIVLWSPMRVGRAQQSVRPKQVLLLYWDDRDHPANLDFAANLRGALQSVAPGGFEYYSEYFEPVRFPGQQQSELFRDFLLQKYASHPIDLVVCPTSVALDFLLKYRNELFTNVPIVFAATHYPEASQLKLGAGATGVVYVTGYRKTLDLALKLHPGTERVFIASSTQVSGESWEEMARKDLQGFNDAAITYLTDLPLEELKTKLRAIPERSIVLYVWEQLRNEKGKFLESWEVLTSIGPLVRVPIYGLSHAMVGRGIVGGYVWTMETRTQRMADFILKVTGGARAADIPVENSPLVPMFDWRELKRWDLDEKLLPPHSVVRFRELTFWQQYRWRIVTVGLILAFQTILIGALLVQRRRARHSASALKESDERFRNMANTAPVLIWVSGPDKLCTFFNKAWMTFAGRPIQNELGNGWEKRMHPDDRDHWSATYASSFDSRTAFQVEYRLRRGDGEYRSLLCAGAPRFEQDGGFAGYIGSCLDITDLKRAQERALAGQKLESMGLLASGIAHDFNNLLGGILTSAELALTERAASAACEEELMRIKTAAISGAQIVRELMIFGASDNPSFEPIDCSLLAREMTQVLKVSISKFATLTTDFAGDLRMVRGNAAQIKQLIMNLVMNASQAIGERRGEIRVATRMLTRDQSTPIVVAANLPEGDYLQLEVADTGNGMTEDVKAKIFDPFFTTKREGRGLGLAVVQGIVRAHRGLIRVATGPGSGTIFQVLLPCMSKGEIAGDISEKRIPVTRTAPELYECAHGTILIIEDEEMLRQGVAKVLRKRGFTVLEAADGNTGVDLFLANRSGIDLVLLDMTLPGRTGAAVLEEIKQVKPELKVILTSAYGQQHVQNSLGGLRAWGYIQKPYRLAELEKLVQQCAAEAREIGRTAAVANVSQSR